MPGWGVEVGRADDSDIGVLLSDQNTLRLALARLQSINKIELGKERMAQLLGIETGNMPMSELIRRSEEWWDQQIAGPMERIAANPAASCDEATEMHILLLGNERQKQLLGLESTGTSEDLFNGKIPKLVNKRCREEILDECNATGRFIQVIQWALGETRQAALISAETDSDKWRAETLSECANYELHYVSTTKTSEVFELDSVIDGRIPIKYKPMGESVGELPIIEGEVATGSNPFLQKFSCDYEDISITCSPGGDVKRPAYGRILFMDIKSREYYLDTNGRSQSKVVGENKLELKFMPALLGVSAVIRPPDSPSYTVPMLEVGGTGFWIAHKKLRFEEDYFKITETTRGTYPVLFEFTITNTDSEEDIPATDSTKFELLHKPKKKPFDKGPAQPPRRVVRPRS